MTESGYNDTRINDLSSGVIMVPRIRTTAADNPANSQEASVGNEYPLV